MAYDAFCRALFSAASGLYYQVISADLSIEIVSALMSLTSRAIERAAATFVEELVSGYEMEPTLTIDGINALLFQAFMVAFNLYIFVAFSSLYPFVAACGHHFKIAGDCSMRVASMVPESIPVINYRTDQEELIDTLQKVYQVACGEPRKTIMGFVKYITGLFKSKFGINYIPNFVVNLLLGYLESEVMKDVIDPVVITSYSIKGIPSCECSRPKGWGLCYVGGFSMSIEALTGPLCFPDTLVLSYNPYIGMWNLKKVKELKDNAKSLLRMIAKMYTSLTTSITLFIRGSVASVFTAVSTIYFALYCSAILPMNKWLGE